MKKLRDDRIHKIKISHQYLNFPVKDGAPKQKVRIRLGTQLVRYFDIEWADDDPDFWVFTDVSAFAGEALTIEIEGIENNKQSSPPWVPAGSLAPFKHSATIEGAENLYREKHRPQFHFTSRRGWMNDPNGLVYYNGTYHLFYQHNPFGRSWGNMHWGYATSQDLVQWTEHSDVLYPDEMGTMFSGTGVVDWHNSSGLQKGSYEPLICFYTAAGEFAEPKVPFTQCFMFSQDGGRSWQKYQNNPVIPAIASGTRDPAVIWDPDSEYWVMVLYIARDESRDKEDQHYALFRSKNLFDWERMQELYFPGMGECPELFPLALDGDLEQLKWVFWTADGHYLVGQFDGNEFVSETGFIQSTYTAVTPNSSSAPFFPGGYAAQTWSDMPAEDGRRIQIAWLTEDIPDMPFNQQMTFPVELTMRTTENGPRLYSWPIKEIELLIQEQVVLENIELSDSPILLPTDGHDCLDILISIEVGEDGEFEFNFRGTSLTYWTKKQELYCLNRTVQLMAVNGYIELRVLLDRASIEIFAANGLIYLPISIVPEAENRHCTVHVREGTSAVKRMQVAKLHTSWK